MRRKETAIEVKVGGLVFVALVLLIGFIFVLGDFQFGEGYKIYVDLENAGGLKPGADIRIAGIPAGTVDSIEFFGGEWDEELERNVFVRVTCLINQDMADAVGEGAEMAITTLGVLGEPYIEIVNTVPPGPAVDEGTIFVGQAPVRTDQIIRSLYGGLQGLDELIETVGAFFDESDMARLLTEGADLAGHLDEVIVDNREKIRETIAHVSYILEENRDAITPILENVEGATAEFERVGRGLNNAIGDGQRLRRAINSLEEVVSAAAEHAPETFADLGATIDALERVIAQQEEALVASVANVETITSNLADASAEASELVAHVNAGRGTVGALLRDDEMYDDIRELIRELKRRPWRLIWKE